MNTFVNSINSVARTENNMRALNTTGSPCLDLFGSIGSSRGKDIIPAFMAAANKDVDTAVRIIQWARDIRGGAGERELFRSVLRNLEQTYPMLLLESRLLENVAEIGRYDDLLIFTRGSEVYNKALTLFAIALSKGDGLASKWAPRKGPIAADIRKLLCLTPRQYRKYIVHHTKVVEQKMCAKEWDEITYDHVPSVAMTKYRNAFAKNDPEGFQKYLESLNTGESKVNASAVYPYQVTKLLGGTFDMSYRIGYTPIIGDNNLTLAQAMWESLPNYMNDKNILAVCDNSASMNISVAKGVTAMDVAVSLTMYTASKNTGAFKDLSVSFSDNASFVRHSGNLHNRLVSVCSAQWAGSTNLHSVFNLVLEHAITNDVPGTDMPEYIVIFSDMQFNQCIRHDDSAIQMIRRKYNQYGYKVPKVVFWNLRATSNVPVSSKDENTALVSGFSPSLMKVILSGNTTKFDPETIMRDTVGIPRYDWM